MILADLHTHTKTSHGLATVEEMYAAAREAGLEYLGISEHSPLPPGFSCRLYQEHFERDFPALCDEVLALKQRGGSPQVLLGIELDWIPSNMPYMRDLLAGKQLHIDADKMVINAQDIDFSTSAEETLVCQYEGNPMSIGFKAPFLIDILNNLPGQDVIIELADPSRAGVIVPAEQEENCDLLMLLMPMMLND